MSLRIPGIPLSAQARQTFGAESSRVDIAKTKKDLVSKLETQITHLLGNATSLESAQYLINMIVTIQDHVNNEGEINDEFIQKISSQFSKNFDYARDHSLTNFSLKKFIKDVAQLCIHTDAPQFWFGQPSGRTTSASKLIKHIEQHKYSENRYIELYADHILGTAIKGLSIKQSLSEEDRNEYIHSIQDMLRRMVRFQSGDIPKLNRELNQSHRLSNDRICDTIDSHAKTIMYSVHENCGVKVPVRHNIKQSEYYSYDKDSPFLNM